LKKLRIFVMISPNNAQVDLNTSLPQQCHVPQTRSMEQTNIINASQSTHHKSYLSPPCYHSSEACFAVTPVELMTIDQTANWVKTLGRYHGWAQVELYAESFRNQGITGALLKELTPEMLEFSLGMRNQRYQQELLSAIQYLYPNMTLQSVPKFQQVVTGIEVLDFSSCGCVNDSGQRSVASDYESINSYLVSSESRMTDTTRHMEYSDMMSLSGYSQRSIGLSYIGTDGGFGNEEINSVCRRQDQMEVIMLDGNKYEDSQKEESSSVCKTLRCRKLLLTLPDAQVIPGVCAIQSIRARFQELKIQVEVLPYHDKRHTYLLAFPNYQRAEEALLRADEIGYKLTKKWPPRPKPKRPLKYKSLAVLKIRAGKSLSGDVVGTLSKGQIVTVNQIKGRRARLIDEKENGKVENIGWVSIHEEDGSSLLKQLGDF